MAELILRSGERVDPDDFTEQEWYGFLGEEMSPEMYQAYMSALCPGWDDDCDFSPPARSSRVFDRLRTRQTARELLALAGYEEETRDG